MKALKHKTIPDLWGHPINNGIGLCALPLILADTCTVEGLQRNFPDGLEDFDLISVEVIPAAMDTLTGEDAERFYQRIENPEPIGEEEMERMKKNFKRFKEV